jgi:hypothetical protein
LKQLQYTIEADFNRDLNKYGHDYPSSADRPFYGHKTPLIKKNRVSGVVEKGEIASSLRSSQ